MKEIKLKEQTLSLDKSICSMIYEIRGQKVMLDFELAEFYGYETKRFNEQVKRNLEKFDETFRFQLNKKEWETILKLKNSTVSSHSEKNLLPTKEIMLLRMNRNYD